MNKFITKVAKLVLGLSLAAGVGVALGSQSKASRVDAADTTVTLAPRNVTSVANKTDDNGETWTMASDAQSFTSSTSYVHGGSGSKTVSYIRFTTSAYSSETIKSISLYGAAKASSSATLKIYVGGTLKKESEELGNTASSGGTELTWTNNDSSSGEIKVEVSRSSAAKAAIYFNQAVVVLAAAEDNRQDSSVTITNGANANVSVGGNLTLTTSTTPNNASLTFSSSDDSVATVSNAGVVTGEGAGSATITASFAGDTNYKPSNAQITVNVSYAEPAHVTGMTVAQILALGSSNLQQKTVIYEVEAYVTEVTANVYTYGNFYVNDTKGDTTNQAYVYGASEDSSKLSFNTNTGLYSWSSGNTNASTLQNKMSVGSKITANFIAFYYNNSTFEFQGIITSVVNESVHSISTSVSNGTYSGATEIGEGSATVTISANTGYKLPTTVTVSGADHTFDRTSGVITLSNATGNVTITASCLAATQYDVTITASNCTYSPANPKIYEESELEITFTANTGYKLPLSAPTVTNATVKSWANGVLTLENPTGNVSFSITAQVKTVDKYGLYTGAITAGQYIIVGAGTNYALKNTISNSRFSNETVTISQNVIQEPADAIVWTISQISGTNYWTIYNEEVNKYAGGTSSQNQGAMLESVVDLAKWTITYNDGYVFYNYGRSQAASNPDKAYLRQNGTNGWATYASSTANAPTLYKLDYLPKAFDHFDYIDGTPDVTNYSVGEPFDPSGLEIHAVYTEPSIYPDEDITSEIQWNALSEGTTATGTWNGETVTITGLTITTFTPVTYTKVTSLDQIAVGSHVIFGFVDGDVKKVCGSFNTKYFEADDTTATDSTMNTTSTSLVWTVEADRNGYYFQNGGSYLNRNNGDNSFGAKSSMSCWSLSFENGQFTMSNESYHFKFNNNSGSYRFKCYTTTSNINIYIKQAASEADVLKTFASRYLLLNNETLEQIPSSSTGVTGTDCLGASGPYITAKTALTSGEFASHKASFQSSEDSIVTNARLRYTSWAAAYGDTTPYATTVGNSARLLGTIIGDNNNTIAIIVVISMVSVTAIGGYFFLKKRREQN